MPIFLCHPIPYPLVLIFLIFLFLVHACVCQAHFVRCIKPNYEQEPNNYVDEFVDRQLRYTGWSCFLRNERRGEEKERRGEGEGEKREGEEREGRR